MDGRRHRRWSSSVEDDRAVWIGRVAAAGGAVEALTTGRRVVERAEPAAARTAASRCSPRRPASRRRSHALENGALRPLSAIRTTSCATSSQFATVADFTSKSKDGTVVHGLLTRPAGAVDGAKLPTVLYIHGGPNGQDDYSFNFDRELFAANGYAVLEVNYRGSAGRGAAFQKAIYADWGNKEVQRPPGRGR